MKKQQNVFSTYPQREPITSPQTDEGHMLALLGLLQPRPQGFSLKKWVDRNVRFPYSPGILKLLKSLPLFYQRTIIARTTWTNSSEGKPDPVVDLDQQYRLTLKIKGKADRTAKGW